MEVFREFFDGNGGWLVIPKKLAGHIEGVGWSYLRGWLVILKVRLGTVRSHMVVPNDWLELRKPSVKWFWEIRRPAGSSDLHRNGY